MAAISTLTDNFDDNSIDTGKWVVGTLSLVFNAGVTVSETGQQLQITAIAGGSGDAYNGYVSVNTYDATDDGIVIEVVQPTTQAGSRGTILELGIDASNFVRMYLEADTVYMQFVTATVGNDPGSFAFNATTHRWWRLRHVTSDDTIRWDTAPDGSTWTQRGTSPRTWAVTAVKAAIQVGTYGNEGATSTAIFDNFNLPVAVAAFEQEGYRWRNDDGSETTATWLAAQDTPITQPKLTNTRLRILLDTSGGDPATTQIQLEWNRAAADAIWRRVNPPFTSPTVAWRDTWQGSAVNAIAHVITWDAGVPTDGQLLLLVFTVDGPEVCTINTTNFPGWVKLADQPDSTNVMTQTVFYKFSTGGEVTVTVDTTTEQSTAVILCIDNAGTPAGTSVGGNSTNANPPNHNPGVSLPYLWIATCGQDSTVVATGTPQTPSVFGNLTTQAAAGTGGASTSTAELTSTASSMDPGAFTSATEQWAAWTIGIPPAAQPPIQLAVSANIPVGGANTTAQLTPPTSGSFGGGRIQDDENPADTVDLALNDYGEWEWCLQATATAQNGEVYQLRVPLLDLYTVTPEWTIGALAAVTFPPKPKIINQAVQRSFFW